MFLTLASTATAMPGKLFGVNRTRNAKRLVYRQCRMREAVVHRHGVVLAAPEGLHRLLEAEGVVEAALPAQYIGTKMCTFISWGI
jgi:hypothetical protein